MPVVVWYRVVNDQKLGVSQLVPVIVDEQIAPALGLTSRERRAAVEGGGLAAVFQTLSRPVHGLCPSFFEPSGSGFPATLKSPRVYKRS